MIDGIELPYRPRDPALESRGIALVGCGSIAEQHLTAYRNAGYRVVALCDPDLERARQRRDAFFPEAEVFPDHGAVLRRDDVEIVDVATHPDVRTPILRDCLEARRHVLSQKPFVTDLDEGERLCDLADAKGVRLAVNQNARWAPHFAWIRAAVASGLLGELRSVRSAVRWDHSWTVGTAFDDTQHLILFDFGIHWFDLATVLFGERPPLRVAASVSRVREQTSRQPALARAAITWEDGSADLLFHGACKGEPSDSTAVRGSRGRIDSTGPDYNHQSVSLLHDEGLASPELEGHWFPDGFHGTMAELLTAIEEDRAPLHEARGNLRSLALAFAACESSLAGEPRVPGEVRRI